MRGGARTYVVLVFARVSDGPIAILTVCELRVKVQCVGGGVGVAVRKLRAVLECQAFSASTKCGKARQERIIPT